MIETHSRGFLSACKTCLQRLVEGQLLPAKALAFKPETTLCLMLAGELNYGSFIQASGSFHKKGHPDLIKDYVCREPGKRRQWPSVLCRCGVYHHCSLQAVRRPAESPWPGSLLKMQILGAHPPATESGSVVVGQASNLSFNKVCGGFWYTGMSGNPWSVATREASGRHGLLARPGIQDAGCHRLSHSFSSASVSVANSPW